MITETVYERLPGETQQIAKRWYYTLHPRLSWRLRRKMDEVETRFVDRFFDDEDEFEAYRQEFFEGRIVDLCGRAVDEAPEGVTVYDAHVTTCVKLYSLIRKRTPETLVETGVHNGVSTLSMLLAIDRNGTGTLHSIDSPERRNGIRERGGPDSTRESFLERGRPSCAEPESAVLPPGEDPGWIIPEDLRGRWQLSTGPDRRKLVEVLHDVGEIDLFLHDSEHSKSRMLAEFELAWEWLSDGGILLSHHVDQNDAFETFVDERDCDHGLFDYLYDLNHPAEDYDEPCSSGYAVKGRE